MAPARASRRQLTLLKIEESRCAESASPIGAPEAPNVAKEAKDSADNVSAQYRQRPGTERHSYSASPIGAQEATNVATPSQMAHRCARQQDHHHKEHIPPKRARALDKRERGRGGEGMGSRLAEAPPVNAGQNQARFKEHLTTWPRPRYRSAWHSRGGSMCSCAGQTSHDVVPTSR